MIIIKTPFRHSPVIEKLPPLTSMGRDFYNLWKERKYIENLCGKKVKIGDISFSKDKIDGVNIVNRLGRYITTIFPDHFDGDIEIVGEL